MISFTLRRLAGLVPTLFVLMTLSFFVIRLAPGGPFDQEAKLSPEVLANLDAAYGLDQPLSVQYGRYLAGVVLPGFVVGPVLALVFGIYWPVFRVAGYEPGDASFLVLPVITLALPVMAYVARLTRDSLVDVLQSNFVRTARAKGLPARIVLMRHALRPALIPVVSYLGPAVAFVVTGSLVVEAVFGLPGTGRFLVQGAIDRDYPLVMGMILVYGVFTLVCNLVADLVYRWLDPRVRLT